MLPGDCSQTVLISLDIPLRWCGATMSVSGTDTYTFVQNKGKPPAV